MWRWGLIVVAVLALGCGGSEATPTAEPSTMSHLGVPLPPGAEESPDSTASTVAMFTVPDWDYDQTVEWYEGQLPDGQPLDDTWQWCEKLDRDTFQQWTYHQPDTPNVLVVVVGDDDGAYVLINSDESGPC